MCAGCEGCCSPDCIALQGLNDFSAGVSKLGANLSLGLRQAAHAMAPYIPDEINPFVDDEEYEELVDEEEERQRRK